MQIVTLKHFISGETGLHTTPEILCENSIQSLTSSQDEVQIFAEDSLDEKFSQSQLQQGVDEDQVNIDEAKINKMQREVDEDQSLMKEVTEEGRVNLQNSAQEQPNAAEQMMETKKDKQNGSEMNKEHKQPALIRSSLLLTELEEEEQLATTHLLMQRSLRIDDLPDLEDVDVEAFTSPQHVIKPKIEVISGGSDEEEAAGIQSDATFSNPDKNSFSISSSNKSAGLFGPSSSLVYPEDEETFFLQPISKAKQSPSTQLCLIEELD